MRTAAGFTTFAPEIADARLAALAEDEALASAHAHGMVVACAACPPVADRVVPAKEVVLSVSR